MISIAIPTFEADGNGWLYLSELLNSIAKQNYKDYEVVISDQSSDDKIKKLCDFYSNEFVLKYHDSRHVQRSNSTNINYAISKCSSDNIKIMFQDDFFIDPAALDHINNGFESGAKWIVSGCYHCTNIHWMYMEHKPEYRDDIYLGNNTISSPTVLAFYQKHYFDENLVMLMDCDMYKRLHNLYGNPYVIEKALICNREHENQMGKTCLHLLQNEVKYLKEKFENYKIFKKEI